MDKAIYLALKKPTIMRRQGSMQCEECMGPNTFAVRTSVYLQLRNHAVFFQMVLPLTCLWNVIK